MPTEWTQETVTDSGTATSTTTPSTAWTVETLDLNVGANTLSLTGNLTLSGLAEIGSDTDKFLMSDSGVLKYVTSANLKSYISMGLNDLTDVTYANGDLTINSLDTIYLPNTTQTYIQTKGKLAFRDWGAGAAFNFLEIDEDNHTIKMDNDTATLTMQVSSSDTYIKSWSGSGADLIVTSNDDVVLNSNTGEILFEKGGISARAIHSFFNFEYADGLAIFNKFQINNPTDIGDDYFNIVVGDKGATTINTVDDAGADADLTFDVDGDIILDSAPGNIIVKHNGGAYTPSSDYQVATKKYVDDNVGGGGDITGVDLTADTGILITSETNTTSGSYSATISCNLEGTELYSTGVTGTTKFLRVDGDNSCSWQVPPNDNTNQLTTFNIGVDTNSNSTTIAHGETLTFTGGTGISTETTADGTITITNTSPNVNTMGSGFTVSATTDSNATTITQGDDLMFAAGTGITCETTADGTVTITNTHPNTDTDVTIANLTSRLPQITESLTIGDASDVDITIAGDLTVNGAVILNSTINGATLGLDVTSKLFQSTGPGMRNTRFGSSAGNAIVSGGDNNCIYGDKSGLAITQGSDNCLIGYGAAKSTTTGDYNIAMCTESLNNNTNGNYNIAIGLYALYGCSTNSSNSSGCPNDNIAIGSYALASFNRTSDTSAYGRNIAIGTNAAKTLTTGQDNTFLGHKAGELGAITGDRNICIGVKPGENLTSGSDNTFMGYESGHSNTIGNMNVSIGYQALYSNTEGLRNIGIGYQSLYTNVDGDNNTGIGYQSLYSLEPAENYGDNTAIGDSSAKYLTSGKMNVYVGSKSGSQASGGHTGEGNVGIGYHSLKSSVDSSNFNTMIGHLSGYSITTSDDNTGVGAGVLYNLQTGARNVAIGDSALFTDADSDESVAIGYEALYTYSSSGDSKNVAIGTEACYTLASGKENTAVGWQALYTANSNESSNTAIGHQALYSLDGDVDATLNTAVGCDAGIYVSTGRNNTFLGARAGKGNNSSKTTGDRNTTVGFNAGAAIEGLGFQNTLIGALCGDNITTGYNNTFIGHHISASAVDTTYEIVIGAGVDGSNDFDGGGNKTCRIGMASDYIEVDFDVNATWAHSSDIRIKKDIEDNNIGLDFINDLRTVSYKKKPPSEYPQEFKGYNDADTVRKNPDKIHYGFIAQEVKETMDKFGCGDFPIWRESKDGMQMIGETELITPLIKAVQELSQKVKDLEGN